MRGRALAHAEGRPLSENLETADADFLRNAAYQARPQRMGAAARAAHPRRGMRVAIRRRSERGAAGPAEDVAGVS